MRRTKNARATGPGRWTRAGLSVSRKSDCPPLPLHLQILPMKMDKTPRNPDCKTTNTQWGQQVEMSRWDTRSFHAGKTLQRSPAAWRIDICGKVFYSDNGLHAIAWVRAANHIRHRCEAVLTQA